MRETRSSRDPFLWLFAISILGFLDVVAQLHGIVAAPGEIADAVSRAEAQLPNGAGVIVGFGLAVLPYLAWFLLRRRLHDNAVLVALCVGTLLAVVTGGLFVSDAVARGRTGSAGGSPSASATRVGYQRGETAAISAFEYDAGNVVAPAGGSGTAQGEIAALASLKATAGTAAADLAGLAPPVDLQADNQQLVDEFQGLAAYLDAEEQAVAAGDSAAADDARAHVDVIASGIDRTVASIDRKLGQ